MNIICDTSVVINFLKINRLDLLAQHSHIFWVTDNVHREITVDYPAQQQLFQNAFENLTLHEPIQLNSHHDLFALFSSK